MNKTKLAIITIILSLPFIYHFWPVTKNNSTASKVVNTIEVNATKVISVNLPLQIEALGSLKTLDQVDISPEIAGQISKIVFKPGSFVKKGTALILLDDTIFRSQLNAAKAKLKLSQMNFDRTQQLSSRRISSAQELDQAQADLQDKQNDVKIKQAQLDKLSLKAPFSGVLGAKDISIGQYVSVGQPLVRLVANQELRVIYQVSERYLPDLALGQTVLLTSDTFPDKQFTGKVDYLSPTIDNDTRSIQIEALIDNKKHILAAGLFVNIVQIIGKSRPTLIIPEESLVPTIKGQQVFVIIENKVSTTDVIIGPHHRGKVEILSGLNPGEEIVTRGQQKLKDGSLITIQSEEKSEHF